MKIITLCFLIAVLTLATNVYALDIPKPNHTIHIIGAKNVRITVQEWGKEGGKPILFIHAWSQSHYGWLPQIKSKLAQDYRLITFDLRGHGNSEKPVSKDQYNNADVWADDLHSIVSTLKLKDVTLVGWSYGSIVIADFISKYGQDNIHALNIVGGITGLGVERVSRYFGQGLTDSMLAFNANLPIEAQGMVNIANMMWPDDMNKDMYGFMIATNMKASPFVRQAMIERNIDYKTLYESLDIPVLFSHGANDTGILLSAAKEGATLAPKGKLSVYEQAKHAPHWSDIDRFNNELSKLVMD